ncbi:MAG: Fic family protein, partial [Oscillospiraceae bacterium]|nr:Fic family protein [Oscillospiraceae bacterium]
MEKEKIGTKENDCSIPLKWDSLRKLTYRANVGIPDAQEELEYRLRDRMELPLPGLRGEMLYLTGVSALRKRARELDMMYEKLPNRRGLKEIILLDAWSSATIEGARTTVEKVKQSFLDPKTKDDRMVVNAIAGSNYAYGQPITDKNIRKLWNKVVDGVCENEGCRGVKYRNGMVYIGSSDRIIHRPAEPEQLPELMEEWFAYCRTETSDLLIRSFVAHFYFVYIHPFCDGNGRTARILNASQLYHSGYKKMKSLPLANAINKQLAGYYNSLSDAETVQLGTTPG